MRVGHSLLLRVPHHIVHGVAIVYGDGGCVKLIQLSCSTVEVKVQRESFLLVNSTFLPWRLCQEHGQLTCLFELITYN